MPSRTAYVGPVPVSRERTAGFTDSKIRSVPYQAAASGAPTQDVVVDVVAKAYTITSVKFVSTVAVTHHATDYITVSLINRTQSNDVIASKVFTVLASGAGPSAANTAIDIPLDAGRNTLAVGDVLVFHTVQAGSTGHVIDASAVVVNYTVP
jgi:hypothetical protein